MTSHSVGQCATKVMRQALGWHRGCEERLQFGLQHGLGHEANKPGEQLAVLEQQC